MFNWKIPIDKLSLSQKIHIIYHNMSAYTTALSLTLILQSRESAHVAFRGNHVARNNSKFKLSDYSRKQGDTLGRVRADGYPNYNTY